MRYYHINDEMNSSLTMTKEPSSACGCSDQHVRLECRVIIGMYHKCGNTGSLRSHDQKAASTTPLFVIHLSAGNNSKRCVS